MNTRRTALLMAACLPASGCGTSRPMPQDAAALAAAPRDELQAQARAAETAFADTMARRDLAAFTACIAPDAVFINGGRPLRGQAAIVEHWKRFFVPAQAPFAWKPELVEIAGDGTLAYTEGPVLDPTGTHFATFYSTWQRGRDGRWLVVFDNGHALCKKT